jgi:deoxyribodipyrimidine photo-lyase
LTPRYPEAALRLGRQAALVVTDRSYLRHQRAWRAWRERVAAGAPCPVVQVEGEAVLPVEAVSAKAEWAAASFRPKVRRLLAEYLPEATPGGREQRTTRARRPRGPRRDSLGLRVDPALRLSELQGRPSALARLRPDPSVPPVQGLHGGACARDRRPYPYDRASLERAETHDPYWNAARREVRRTGRRWS